MATQEEQAFRPSRSEYDIPSSKLLERNPRSESLRETLALSSHCVSAGIHASLFGVYLPISIAYLRHTARGRDAGLGERP